MALRVLPGLGLTPGLSFPPAPQPAIVQEQRIENPEIDPAGQGADHGEHHGDTNGLQGDCKFATQFPYPIDLVQPLNDSGVLHKSDGSEHEQAQHNPGCSGDRGQQVDQQN